MGIQNGNDDPAYVLRGVRTGFGVFLASQTVVFITIIAVRFLMAYGSVGPYSQALGAVITVLMVASALVARTSRQAVKNGDLSAMAGRLVVALALGAAAFLLVLLEWVALRQSGIAMTTPTLEVYFTLTGFWLLYALIGGFLLIAARARGLRVGYTAASHWDLEAATYFWTFVALAWIAVYLVLYVL
ncbi:MAG: cytochrome c oxidase subunit 3 [Thermaerobacter sp.]|nr:cytochrome c oxidase subunit 3 [Thermaerobacter sp.]